MYTFELLLIKIEVILLHEMVTGLFFSFSFWGKEGTE